MQVHRILWFLVVLPVLFFFGAKCDNASHLHSESADKPAVTATAPPSHATGVSLNPSIRAIFNDSMDPATLTSSTFQVEEGGTLTPGSVTTSGSVATFTPNSPLIANTLYSATVTTAVADTKGKHLKANYLWTFTTTATVDLMPPTVDSVYPLNAATNVSINTQVSVTFSEAMNPGSLNSATFTMTHGGTPVTGLVNTVGATAVFEPTGNLDINTLYTVTITAGITDSAGNALESNYTWTFTTGNTADTTAPLVTFQEPSDTSTGVTLNTHLHAIFSEPLDPQTANALTFQLHQGATSISGVAVAQGNEMFFTPDAVLNPNAVYTALLTTNITDMAGNPLGAAEEWSFTTGASTTPIATVSLGHAGHFGVLAGTSVNVVATSDIVGDVGLSPAGETFITGLALTDATGYATSSQVSGLVYAADMADPTPATLVQARSDLTLAFADAEGRTPIPTGSFFNPGSGDLGGLTLAPGLYQFATSAQATSAFTLNGSATDIWIFQIPAALQVSNGVHMYLGGGAQAKNIFWQVGSHVTMGQNVIFNGTLMANDEITLNQNIVLNGRALSRSAAVTLIQGEIITPAP